MNNLISGLFLIVAMFSVVIAHADIVPKPLNFPRWIVVTCGIISFLIAMVGFYTIIKGLAT